MTSVLTRNSNQYSGFSFINNGMDGAPENTGNMLMIECPETGVSIAAGVGVRKLECNYTYVPSLEDVVLPGRIIRPVGDTSPILYEAKTEVWNTDQAWLEYSAQSLCETIESTKILYLTGNFFMRLLI